MAPKLDLFSATCILSMAFLLLLRKKRSILQNQTKKRRHRRWQVRPSNRNRLISGQYSYFKSMKNEDPEQFFDYTNMDPASFDVLLAKIKPYIVKRHLRALPAEMKLAITLQYLSQGTSTQQLARMYGVGNATVWEIVREVNAAIQKVLMPEVLPRPTAEDWCRISQNFEELWNVPNAIGVVDAKQISIQSPSGGGTFTVVLMGVVDDDYNFVVVDIGAYGSETDGGVFGSTDFGRMIMDGTVCEKLGIPQTARPQGMDSELPLFIIGDENFPLKPNCMKPYGNRHATEKHAIFNYRLSRPTRVADNAFGVLAARWGFFRHTKIARPDRTVSATLTAILLHNFIKKRNVERYMPPGYVDVETEDGSIVKGEFRQDQPNNLLQPLRRIGSNNYKKEAFEIREKLADYFASPQGELPWQLYQVRKGRLNNS